MSEFPGIIRTSIRYLRGSLVQFSSLILGLGFVCVPTLYAFIASGDRIATFALFGFLGLVAYLGQVGLNGNLTSVDEQTDSNIVGFVVAILVVVYYNCLIFSSVLFATTTSLAGFEQYGIAIALLYPFYDIEMMDMAAPLSIGGAFVFSVSVVAWFVQKVEAYLNIRYLADEIDYLSRLKDYRAVVRDFALLKFSHTGHGGRRTS